MKHRYFRSWLFVSVQAVLLLVLFVWNDTGAVHGILRGTGRGMMLAGTIALMLSLYDLRKSLTPLPIPKTNGVLQTRGLYRFVRHPMYGAVLLLSFGTALASGSAWKLLCAFALLLLFWRKAVYEESLLVEKYDGYKAYARRTGRFLPKLF